MRGVLLSGMLASFLARSRVSRRPATLTQLSHGFRSRPIGSSSREEEVRLVQDALHRIRQVNHMPSQVRRSLLEFRVADRSLGWVRPTIARLLCGERVEDRPMFRMSHDRKNRLCITLTEFAGDSFDARSAAVARVMEQLRDRGVVQGWRDELYPIKERFDDPPLFAMERAAVPLIGALEYGVHINGLVRHDMDTKMWIARRSKTKSKYPGMLDHIVAGGVPQGIALMQNIIKECQEEAGISEQLVINGVQPAGAVSYEFFSKESDTVTRAVLFCYDIMLPNDFVPRPIDGEVEEFVLMNVNDVKKTLTKDCGDPMKPNCYLVVIDFLLRAGFVSPEIPGYLDILRELRGGDCM